MGRDPQLMNAGKVRVSIGIEATEKQIVDPGAAKFSRWQADAVYHQQGDVVGADPFIVMGRRHPAGLFTPPCAIDGKNGCGFSHRLLDSQWGEGRHGLCPPPQETGNKPLNPWVKLC
ncbi:hypothetical protein D3C75_1161480 [compost metagenome]